MSVRVWKLSYRFDGRYSEPNPVGCMCDDYGAKPHYHDDRVMRRPPDFVESGSGQRVTFLEYEAMQK